jgi:hypothetical protein
MSPSPNTRNPNSFHVDPARFLSGPAPIRITSSFLPYAEESWLINVPRRKDRKERALAHCRAQGFDPFVFPAYDGKVLTLENKNSSSDRFGPNLPMTSGELCCTLSHTAVIRSAYARGVKSLLIVEDDITFTPDFHVVFKKFWDEKPEDMAVCWGTYEFGMEEPTPISEHVQQHTYSFLSLFVIYTEHALKSIVQDLNTSDAHYYVWDEYFMLRAPQLGLKVYGPRKKIMAPYDHNGDSDIQLPKDK